MHAFTGFGFLNNYLLLLTSIFKSDFSDLGFCSNVEMHSEF